MNMITRSLSMPGHNLPRRERSLSEPSSPTISEDVSRTAERRLSLHSGIAALLQAASSQLVDLAELAAARCQEAKRKSRSSDNGYPGEDSGSSDAGENMETPSNNTPMMLPEADTRRHSFPEVLMTLLLDPNNANMITFLPDNKYFAIRTKEFSENLLSHHFTVTNFEDFLELTTDWGFSRVDIQQSGGIEVFRHSFFKKGDWKKCSEMKMGESSSPLEMKQLLPSERNRVDFSHCQESTQSNSKRRLSPSYARQESEVSINSHKQKKDDSENIVITSSVSVETECRRSDEVRSLALAITSQKLNLNSGDYETKQSAALVDRAVENATRAIFTDAVESLLRDEQHSRETYLKHENELGTSSLPGVIPISKQLFSSSPVNPNTCDSITTKAETETTLTLFSSLESSASASSSSPPNISPPPLPISASQFAHPDASPLSLTPEAKALQEELSKSE